VKSNFDNLRLFHKMNLIKRPLQFLVIAAISALLLTVVASSVSPKIAWRVKLVRLKLSGEIPEIPLALLFKWARPDSPVNLYHLTDTGSVDAGISNSFTDPESAAAGGRKFARVCAQCHGDNARGLTAPDLLAAIVNMSDWKFFSTVKWGRPNSTMAAQPLSDLEIWQVCAFLRESALNGLLRRSGADVALSSFEPVSPDRLLAPGKTGNWLTYAGNYAGHRHAAEDQITRDNVHRLRLAWAAQLPSDGSLQESSPIVVGRRIFVTETPEGVSALDTRNGAVLWQFHRPVPSAVPSCCGPANKGVAILGNNIYVETFDAHLLALDGATGSKIWDVEVADWHQGYSMTGVPLAIDDRIVVGVAGGDIGVRGFLAAYSASDGAQQWKFYTAAEPAQPGSNTWGGDSWKHGGATTWASGAYDPALGLIFWGTGNPDPVFNAKNRPGDNLYACSVVALDARTGQLRWYYQFTPSDDHGWDSAQQPVLADISWQGHPTPALLLANRNAFFYALERRTGRFLFAKPYAKQTWASGFTESGRPIAAPDSHPGPAGNAIWPGTLGATNWWPPSFDPDRGLLFVPATDDGDTYFNYTDSFENEREKQNGGRPLLPSGFLHALNEPTTLAVRAIDVSTGQIRWDSTLEKGGAEVKAQLGGVLSTAGGLVFSGHSSEFDAFDADTGEKLWSTPLGSDVHAAPISYTVDDRQHIAVFGGRTLFVFALPLEDQNAAKKSRKLHSRPR
jgi:alcohol dehydrogenase (cytochrome c)